MTTPATLPRVPLGFRQILTGTWDGIASYRIVDPDGRELPITYRRKVDHRHDYPFRGYQIDGRDEVHATWAELAAAWDTHRTAGATT